MIDNRGEKEREKEPMKKEIKKKRKDEKERWGMKEGERKLF